MGVVVGVGVGVGVALGLWLGLAEMLGLAVAVGLSVGLGLEVGLPDSSARAGGTDTDKPRTMSTATALRILCWYQTTPQVLSTHCQVFGNR
jgi:hypothetical protein